MLEDITVLIKTFERYESLDYLLSSIAKGELPCHVLIADDSKIPYRGRIQEKYGDLVDEYIVLPFDSGASRGRNVLVNHVPTKYFLLCEDDFIFDDRTNLGLLLEYLENSDIELLAGMCYNRGLLIVGQNGDLIRNLLRFKVRTLRQMLLWRLYQNETLRTSLPVFHKEVMWDWYGHFQFEDGICYMSRLSDSDYRAPFTRCDYVPNFFMAKTQALFDKNVCWDDDIKFMGEHLDFFFRAKRQSLNVAITKDVGVVHQRIHNACNRTGRDDRSIMMQKNNLREIRRVDRV